MQRVSVYFNQFSSNADLLRWKKVIEEIEEMHEIENFKSQKPNSKNQEELNLKLEKEVGDVFFALVNYARFLNINPEDALRRTNEKFINRFNYVQKKVKETGKAINESNLEEMDKLWNEAKTNEKKKINK